MRILAVCRKPIPAERVSGVGNAAWNMASGLARLGNSLLYVCKTERRVPRIRTVEGVKVWQLPTMNKMLPLLLPIAILRFKPEIIQIHGGIPCAYFRESVGYRTVLTRHSSGRRQINNDYDLITCVSRTVRASIAEEWRGIAVVALSGVNSQFFQKSENLARNQRMVLTVSDINRVKGLDTTARAILEASSVYPELSWVHVGKCTDQAHLDKVNSVLRGSPVKADFVGYKDHDSLLPYYQSAGVFVSSSNSEGLPLTVLEAMATGCPICVSDIPSHREIVTPGRNGLVFRRKDHAGLASMIIRVLEDKCLARRLSLRASKTARKMTWERNGRSLERHFRRLLCT